MIPCETLSHSALFSLQLAEVGSGHHKVLGAVLQAAVLPQVDFSTARQYIADLKFYRKTAPGKLGKKITLLYIFKRYYIKNFKEGGNISLAVIKWREKD